MLANLECEITNVSIRVLTAEYNTETKGIEIPTFLIRLTNLDYRSTKPAGPPPESGKLKLNKQIKIGQYAIFLMNNPILSNVIFLIRI